MTKKNAVEPDLRKQLAAVGLNPAKLIAPVESEIPLAPEGVDPRTMPVTDIVFDERLLDEFTSLKAQRKAAATKVFALYQSPRSATSTDRNSLLWSEISKFITRVQRSRLTGSGHVKELVKASEDEKQMLAWLRSKGLSTMEGLEKALSE